MYITYTAKINNHQNLLCAKIIYKWDWNGWLTISLHPLKNSTENLWNITDTASGKSFSTENVTKNCSQRSKISENGYHPSFNFWEELAYFYSTASLGFEEAVEFTVSEKCLRKSEETIRLKPGTFCNKVSRSSFQHGSKLARIPSSIEFLGLSCIDLKDSGWIVFLLFMLILLRLEWMSEDGRFFNVISDKYLAFSVFFFLKILPSLCPWFAGKINVNNWQGCRRVPNLSFNAKWVTHCSRTVLFWLRRWPQGQAQKMKAWF